jgi:membrane dipeptidase
LKIIVDAHEDIAYNFRSYGRDYRHSAYHKRGAEAGSPLLARSGEAMVGLPDALIGRVAVTFATLFAAPANKVDTTFSASQYSTPKEAFAIGSAQMDYYERLCDEDERLRIVHTKADLDAVLATWRDNASLEHVQQGLVVLMENADPILEPKQFEEWYERGVRVVGPAWSHNRYTGGTGYPGGLTHLGKELLEVMASFNAILDLSHMAEQAYFEALDRFSGVLIASHSNARRFSNTDRNISDVMIQRLAERDGVIGTVLYNPFLDQNWRSGDPKRNVPFSKVIDSIDHVCQITGSARHAAIGADLDGGFGAESAPEGFDTIADLWKIDAALAARGYSEDDITAILGGNMLRQLRASLPG